MLTLGKRNRSRAAAATRTPWQVLLEGLTQLYLGGWLQRWQGGVVCRALSLVKGSCAQSLVPALLPAEPVPWVPHIPLALGLTILCRSDPAWVAGHSTAPGEAERG